MLRDTIIRAWKDPEYRLNLSAEEQALLPENPAGAIELTDDELDMAVGGNSYSNRSSYSNSNNNYYNNSYSNSNNNSNSSVSRNSQRSSNKSHLRYRQSNSNSSRNSQRSSNKSHLRYK